jgi:hypothetical protein
MDRSMIELRAAAMAAAGLESCEFPLFFCRGWA